MFAPVSLWGMSASRALKHTHKRASMPPPPRKPPTPLSHVIICHSLWQHHVDDQHLPSSSRALLVIHVVSSIGA